MPTISNNNITAEISLHGAEMIRLQKNGKDLLWNADPTYWKRNAPILFPIVGKVFDGKYLVDGKEYQLPQHGFARDMDFVVVSQKAESISLELKSNAETLAKYPFEFVLRATYTLSGNGINACWTIENPSDKAMHFQIGAHPAFRYDGFQSEDAVHGYLQLLHKSAEGYVPVNELQVREFLTQGYVSDKKRCWSLQNGTTPLTDTLFEQGAIILEDNQVQQAILQDKERKEILRVTFDQAPVLGIWSPEGKHAPFICIEPWMGRCDREGYHGEFSQRDWNNTIKPHSSSTFSYSITF